MREHFVQTSIELLDESPRTAVVLADISADRFKQAKGDHPERVINVGIREQLMIGAAGGLALTGMRPIVHTFATFAVDRAYEQIKLDLSHQGVGAVLASIGASYDGSYYGRTHFSPGDVALLDTFDGWEIHVPGHPDEVGTMLRAAAPHDRPVYVRLSEQQNSQARASHGRLEQVQDGRQALVVAVGPMLDHVLAATAGLDVSVAYTSRPRPFDTAGLRAMTERLERHQVVLVEPYLAGTSSRIVTDALSDVPHRLLARGVGRKDLRRYGSPSDHDRWHGLDPASLRTSIADFVAQDRLLTSGA